MSSDPNKGLKYTILRRFIDQDIPVGTSVRLKLEQLELPFPAEFYDNRVPIKLIDVIPKTTVIFTMEDWSAKSKVIDYTGKEFLAKGNPILYNLTTSTREEHGLTDSDNVTSFDVKYEKPDDYDGNINIARLFLIVLDSYIVKDNFTDPIIVINNNHENEVFYNEDNTPEDNVYIIKSFFANYRDNGAQQSSYNYINYRPVSIVTLDSVTTILNTKVEVVNRDGNSVINVANVARLTFEKS